MWYRTTLNQDVFSWRHGMKHWYVNFESMFNAFSLAVVFCLQNCYKPSGKIYTQKSEIWNHIIWYIHQHRIISELSEMATSELHPNTETRIWTECDEFYVYKLQATNRENLAILETSGLETYSQCRHVWNYETGCWNILQ